MARKSSTLLLSLFMMTLVTGCVEPARAVESPVAEKDVRCLPLGEHRDQVGCWILGSQPVTAPRGGQVYWHIYEFASAELAAQAKVEDAEVIAAYGRIYLMVVTSRQWTPKGGRHVASLGPMQLVAPVPHTATFLQTWLISGMQTRVHMHDGPEALLILDGQQCVETPDGSNRARSGEQVLIPAKTPMVLHAAEGGRRALAVIVHPSGQSLGHAHEWQPTGACNGG